tara:strand:+ start:413 stop:751 length:339 start_codon:yes stop_codon:yes gene_type:complete
MFKIKIFISFIVFSSLLIGTSILKNQTRAIEKQIYNISKKILTKEEDLNKSQLDFSYLTSPSIIEKKIEYLDKNQYEPMEYSKIFLSMSIFLDLENKIVIEEKQYEKKTKKK